jgi:hypothetical protein
VNRPGDDAVCQRPGEDERDRIARALIDAAQRHLVPFDHSHQLAGREVAAMRALDPVAVLFDLERVLAPAAVELDLDIPAAADVAGVVPLAADGAGEVVRVLAGAAAVSVAGVGAFAGVVAFAGFDVAGFEVTGAGSEATGCDGLRTGSGCAGAGNPGMAKLTIVFGT